MGVGENLRRCRIATSSISHAPPLKTITYGAAGVRCCRSLAVNKLRGMEPIDLLPEEGLGPAMRALDDRRRRFVMAAITYPTAKDWQIAKAAGYSDRSYGGLRVAAHRLFHDEKVLAAIREEAARKLRSSAFLGAAVLAEIARTKGHPDQLKAATALLNRIGFHEKTEQVVNVNHRDMTGEAMVARIEKLAAALGLDSGALLGLNAAPKMIDGEVLKNGDPRPL